MTILNCSYMLYRGKCLPLLITWLLSLSSILSTHHVEAFLPQIVTSLSVYNGAPATGLLTIHYSPFSEEHTSSIEFSIDTDISKKDILPSRTKKQRKRKRRQIEKLQHPTRPRRKKNVPVSSDELAKHVSDTYIYGPDGVIRESRKRTLHRERSSILFETDSSHITHAKYLHKLDRHPALVLNADYQPLSLLPLSLWNWQETVKSVFSGKVQVVDVYPDVYIRAVNLDMPLPSVVALTEYVPPKNQRPAFTRRNLFLRDGYKCQYCGDFFRTDDLSLDHVLPRCMGGKLSWENTVTSCKKCNGRKGSLLPANLRAVGMKLLREPYVPSKFELAAEAAKLTPRKFHPTWAPYLSVSYTAQQTVEGEKRKD